MPFRRSSLAAVTAAALLALPAPALAQSAGDEQYADPFQGTTESGDSSGRQGTGNQPAQPDSPASGQSGAERQSTAAGQPQATPSQAQPLPYTGLPGLPLAGIGVALLVLGFALRRLARPAYRMFY